MNGSFLWVPPQGRTRPAGPDIALEKFPVVISGLRLAAHPGTTWRRWSGMERSLSAWRPVETRNRDRGESRDSSPPTPPYVRVRIRRFGELGRSPGRDGSQTE